MSLEELCKLRDQVKNKIDLREKGDQVEQMIVVRVAMATCGIAAGAREVMNYLSEEVSTRHLHHVMITQGDCIGHCYAEPIVEVIKPGQEPIAYGHVTKERALEILDLFILRGEFVEGILPMVDQSLQK